MCNVALTIKIYIKDRKRMHKNWELFNTRIEWYLFARKFIISIIYADLNIITFDICFTYEIYLLRIRNLYQARKRRFNFIYNPI